MCYVALSEPCIVTRYKLCFEASKNSNNDIAQIKLLEEVQMELVKKEEKNSRYYDDVTQVKGLTKVDKFAQCPQ